MAPPKNHTSLPLLLLLLLPTTTLAAPTTYSSLCAAPSSAPDHDAADTSPLPLNRLNLYNGYFSGGGEGLFGPDPSFPSRSFSFQTDISRTTDRSILHLSATLTLSGGRRAFPLHGRRRLLGRARIHHARFFQNRQASASFYLDGYYSFDSSDLCMVGSGSGTDADDSAVHFSSVVLRLRLPKPATLSHPFVSGSLESAAFKTNISLVAYPEDSYDYTESASCHPPPHGHAPGALQVVRTNFSCHKLQSLLTFHSYRLEYRSGDASTASPLRQHGSYMQINQLHCSAHDDVRAYVVFTNRTGPWGHFLAGQEAVIAEGFWDSAKGHLCLKGCRVVNPGPSRADLAVGDCDIRMNFWFPAVWSIRDRSIATGLIWNVSTKSGNAVKTTSGVITASSTGGFRGNLSDVKYDYTRVEEAKYYYSQAGLSKERKGRFPGNNSTSYRDLEFQFFLKKQGGSGHASLLCIGSMLFDTYSWMLEDHFSPPVRPEAIQRLLDVSYDMAYYVPHNWSPGNQSMLVPKERRSLSAEGVYDAKTGSLCMVGCQESNGTTDCKVLVTVKFASLDSKGMERGEGTISSLRNKGDPLFFETLDIGLYGMYTDQLAESIWRMDMESAMVLISMTLSCVFIVLQLRHVKKSPEALPAVSITMLVVLALGYMTPLVIDFEALFMASSRQTTIPLSGGAWLEVNKAAVRVLTMLALLLQLRFLQLAWSERSMDRSRDERKALWICLLSYFVGAVVTVVNHMKANHARTKLLHVANYSLVGPTLWEDLVSYGGLILDGFLLPQVAMNAFWDSKVGALSPWFYAGNTVLRSAPHVYDAYRSELFVPSLRPSYLYASPRDDLFGVAWDMVIPCGAMLLAVVVFLQQRLVGAFFRCSRNRKATGYEMVSTVSS